MSDYSADVPEKSNQWIKNLLGLLSLIVLIGGGLAFGESFGGIVWLLVKWVLSLIAIAAVLAVSKAKPEDGGVSMTLNVAMFIAAIVVLMLD